MTDIIGAAVSSVPVLGDFYGLMQSFGNRGGQVMAAIKSGNPREALGSIAALGVETAGEALLPDNPAFGAIQMATGERVEEMAGEYVKGKIVGNSKDGFHVEGQKGQGHPVKMNDKQIESLQKVTEKLAEYIKEDKDIPKEWQKAAAELEKHGETREQIEEAKKTLAVVTETEMLIEASKDGEIDKSEAKKIAEFREEMEKNGIAVSDGGAPTPGAAGSKGQIQKGRG